MMKLLAFSPVLFASMLACLGCDKGPPEPIKSEPTSPPPAASAADVGFKKSASDAPKASAASAAKATSSKLSDPVDGKWSLADATKDLKGTGPLVAKIDTSKGALQCRLYDDKAPVTVANFIGLARGTRPWKDASGWIARPAYDGTTFHRVIKGFMIQGGDAKGDGSGEPGYVIKDEIWDGAKHDRAGLLCMANRGPNTNGAQFFITDAAAAHLDASYTIFGECAPLETVHAIANVPVMGERPQETVTIKSVTISRDKPAGK